MRTALLVSALATTVLPIAGNVAAAPVRAPRSLDSLTSSDWLALLPEGETKRRFILDCTGCHQFDERIALADGKPKTAEQFETAIHRMLGYAGGDTGFPVIAGDREARATARWLALNVTRIPSPRSAPKVDVAPSASVTEFALPIGQGLPHDVALDSRGNVVVTGMMSHQMFVRDAVTGTFHSVAIPVDRANPRAADLDSAGNWWVVLGGPEMLARYSPTTAEWQTFPTGMYPHSLAIGRDGDVWFNGHFTRKPELIGRVTASGRVETFEVPPHPVLADWPGGPIPYEIRAGANGIIWGSELQGNRIFSFDPASKHFRVYHLPTTYSGPRRLDVDVDGSVWIPGYTSNELLHFDPVTEQFRSYRIPETDVVPYVVRIDPANRDVWIGTSAANTVYRFRPATGRFTAYRLPSRGALVRHLAVDEKTHDVWVAYGAWPGRVPSTIARISAR